MPCIQENPCTSRSSKFMERYQDTRELNTEKHSSRPAAILFYNCRTAQDLLHKYKTILQQTQNTKEELIDYRWMPSFHWLILERRFSGLILREKVRESSHQVMWTSWPINAVDEKYSTNQSSWGTIMEDNWHFARSLWDFAELLSSLNR